MNHHATAPSEVTRFLREHPPFNALEAETVERVAAASEVEFHRSGTTIIAQGAEPLEHLWVVRSGAVELVHDGRILDLLGEGEMFGQASMLSGLPTGFEARAAEDTLCYRIPAEVAREPLAAPAGLRFIARSLLELSADLLDADERPALDPAQQPVERADPRPAGRLLARRFDQTGCRADGRCTGDLGGDRPRRRLARHVHRP